MLLCLWLGPPAAHATRAAGAAQVPVDFRCSSLRLYSNPDRVVCSKSVVLRRQDLWLCCTTFEGTQDSKTGSSGKFERLTCHGNVRAQRGDEMMWADEAVFMVSSGMLVLSGKPLLKRGASLLGGRRVIIDTTRDRAHIESPSGRVNRTDKTGPAAEFLQTMAEGPLPRACPLMARP